MRRVVALVLLSLVSAGCAGDSDSKTERADGLRCEGPDASARGGGDATRVVFDVAGDYDDPGQDILEVDTDSGRLRTLTRRLALYADSPVVSPDGRHIAFDAVSASGGTESDVYVMRADGTDPRGLVPRRDGYSFVAGWSPDGKSLLYVLLDARERTSLWTIRIDGTGKRRLAREADHGVWSPDGDTIAFVRDEATEHPSVHALDPRNGRSWLLARDADLPRWTPNSECVVFDRSLQGGRSGFYVVDRDGGTPRRIRRFSDAGDPYLAGVSPDGRWVLAGNLPGLSRISLATGRLERLTSDEGDWAPAWSPDGRRIAFERGGDIWVMAANGENERVVAKAPRVRVYGAPQWLAKPGR